MGNYSLACQLRAEAVHDGLARQPMKSIAPDAGLPETLRQRKARGMLRQCAMKRRIEARHLGHTGKTLCGKTNHVEGRRYVNRSKRSRSFKLLQHFRRDELMLAQLRAAVDDPMANHVRLGQGTLVECLGKKFSSFFGP